MMIFLILLLLALLSYLAFGIGASRNGRDSDASAATKRRCNA